VSCVALHAVQSTAVHRDHGALHINEIILAQLLARPFVQTNIVPQGRAGTQRDRYPAVSIPCEPQRVRTAVSTSVANVS
jgi:hypothetical protein